MKIEDPYERWQNLRARDLAFLARAESEVRRGFGRFSLDTIPLDDAGAFRRLLERPVRRLVMCGYPGRLKTALLRCKPTKLMEYAAAYALWRPGPIQAGIYDCFRTGELARPKHEAERLLLPFTRQTRGVLVFQEQFMEASAVLFGFSAACQNSLRKAFGKKSPPELAMAKAGMLAAAVKRGMTYAAAIALFEHMLRFGGYAFSRGHALECVTIAYKVAWLDLYYPRESRAAARSGV